MPDSKELFMQAHEELIEQHMELYGTDYETASKVTVDRAYERVQHNIAAAIDWARDEAKYRGM